VKETAFEFFPLHEVDHGFHGFGVRQGRNSVLSPHTSRINPDRRVLEHVHCVSEACTGKR
jgi:hypothetical protein